MAIPNLVRNTKINKEYYESLQEFLSKTGVVLGDSTYESVVEVILLEKGKKVYLKQKLRKQKDYKKFMET